jgi:serine/threonine-protein kinase RsbW
MITNFIIYDNYRPHTKTINWQTWSLRSCEEITPVIENILAVLEAAGYSSKDKFAIRLSLEEALVNAIKHGHKGDPGKEVQLRYYLGPDSFLAEIEDQGPGFNLEDVPDPLALENREHPCGRGLILMRSFMTWVRFNEAGNRVTLCRRRRSA